MCDGTELKLRITVLFQAYVSFRCSYILSDTDVRISQFRLSLSMFNYRDPRIPTFKLNRLQYSTDRSIALKYVNLLTHLKSDNITVKRNRNAFFKYFIQVLEDQLNTEAKTKIRCTCSTPNEVLAMRHK